MIIEYTLPRELSDSEKDFISVALHRSLRLDELSFSCDGVRATLGEQIAQDKFDEIMRNLLYVARSINRKTLFESSHRASYTKNPMAELIASGDVCPVSDGMFSFQGDIWRVILACHALSLAMARRYDATEQEHPVLWPVDLYRKINYLSEFPQQVVLAAPVAKSFDARDNFARRYAKSQQYDTVAMDEHMAHAQYGLQCAVCDICYYNLRGRRNYRNTLYTTCNKVFRNEYSATGSLDRLTNFTVRDIMFVGDRDFVLLHRQKMLDEAQALLDALQLESKLETADDPFFTNDAVVKNLFQSTSELKHELLVRLPYANSFMAVGSVNMHLDFFGHAFDIQLDDNSAAYSGCFGVGFERLAFALYSQHGPRASAWPAPVRHFLQLDV